MPTQSTQDKGGIGLNLPTIGTIGGLGTSLAGLIAGIGQNREARETLEQLLANSQALQRLILPFAQQLLGYGINPTQFLKSPQGQAMLKPLQEATAKNFEGARQGLIDTSAGAGFSPGSGMVQGPLANLFGEEALAQSGNIAQLIAQSQNAGIQGANLIGGQQGANLPFANAIAGLPNTGFQIAGAGGQFLNTLLQLQSLNRVFGTPGGCWVLTAVYGKCLKTQLIWAYWTKGWSTTTGRLFVKLYYAHGEKVASFVRKNATARKLLEKLFDAVFYQKALPWAMSQVGG